MGLHATKNVCVAEWARRRPENGGRPEEVEEGEVKTRGSVYEKSAGAGR